MKKDEDLNKVPANVPRFEWIAMAKKRYSEPKLYIPRKNGKPSVEPGSIWYVYFYWRTEPGGKLDRKFIFKKGINRLDSIQTRKNAGNKLIEVLRQSLELDWNPETKKVNSKKERRTATKSLQKALLYAYEVKTKGAKKTPTLKGYEFHANKFLEWAKLQGYHGMDVREFDIDHFYEFLDYLRFDYLKDNGEPLSGTSINNFKRSLSALFTTLKNERIIKENIVKGIPAFDQDPVNNKAFTLEELTRIKQELRKDDPYLIPFIGFILYPLLRIREICRLTVGDINLEQSILGVETKTENVSYRRIIKKLQPFLEEMDLDKYPAHYHVFTNKNEPGVWDVPLATKVDHFGKRFRKTKVKLGFGREYGLYSCRHTAIMDMFYSLQRNGKSEQEVFLKLMSYTQHKSIAGVKNYVRKHQRSIPSDHSDIYTIDF